MTNLWDPETYLKAWHFATHAHQGQTYGGPKDGMRIAYINHIGSVAMEVGVALAKSSNGYDGDLAVQCALLHDIIEDTEGTYHEIHQTFGQAVADGVAALTKDKTMPTKTAQMVDSLTRIKEQPQEVWMVKLADRITNLYQPPFYWDADKMHSYREEAQLIYSELHPANQALADRLKQRIEEYPRFFEKGNC